MAGDEQRLLRMLVNIASFMAFIVVIACLYWGQTVLAQFIAVCSDPKTQS
jgi:hypothetical protein